MEIMILWPFLDLIGQNGTIFGDVWDFGWRSAEKLSGGAMMVLIITSQLRKAFAYEYHYLLIGMIGFPIVTEN